MKYFNTFNQDLDNLLDAHATYIRASHHPDKKGGNNEEENFLKLKKEFLTKYNGAPNK